MFVLHLIEGPIKKSIYRGVYGLHKELINIGIESLILTRDDEIIEDSVFKINKSIKDKIKSRLYVYLDQALPFKSEQQGSYNIGMLGLNFFKNEIYEKADIIHLHWMNSGFLRIKDLYKIKKPIVWTMRDMWPMTGGCHYSLECEKYKENCGDCLFLKGKNKIDLSFFVINKKIKYIPKNVNMIGISPWLTEKALESNVFKCHNVETIENGINCGEYYPVNKQIAKKALQIDTNKKIVLTGATSLKERYKGFSEYLKAIETIDRNKYYLCFFGDMDEKIIKNTGFEYKVFGYLEDIVSMRLIYSASDVFVASSVMEAFGKTIVESMACGTPVVCFDMTGPKSVVMHKKNGYKAMPNDIHDLARGIEWVANNDEYCMLSNDAINSVLSSYDNKVVAAKYADLYHKILKR